MVDVVIYRSRGPWTFPWVDAMADGLRGHRIDAEIRPANEIRASDVAIIWAHKHAQLFDLQRGHGGRYLVMERGYVGDRYRYTSLGFDGLNGRAAFPTANDGGERWERLFADHMQPWIDRPDAYTLVLAQVPNDASIAHHNHIQWLARTIKQLEAMGEIVRFRPHPQAVFGVAIEQVYGQIGPASSRPLEIDLCEAKAAVGFNSNSTLDAVLAGVPTVTMDEGAMAWPVTSHDLGYLMRPDRERWAHDLAFCQWSRGEIASGEAWEHLRRCL